MHRAQAFLASIVIVVGMQTWVSGAEVEPLLKQLNAVGPMGSGHQAAIAAWQQLAKADVSQLTAVLAGIDDENPLAANWIRAAAETIADRHVESGQSLPLGELEQFVRNVNHSPRARRMAFEWLTQAEPAAEGRLIPQLLHDPSVEFRRDAVAQLIEQADPLFDAQKEDEAAALYRRAFEAARDLDQIKHLAKRLRELKQEVDLPTHFGFLVDWKLIGPFDNTEKKGFDVAYPPERAIDFSATYEGKTGAVKWIDHHTDDDYGMVDLNKALGKHMGAVGYAAVEYDSPREQTVELRLGCVNASKIWLNGELVDEHEVYHAGTRVDQYIKRVTLRKGMNLILVKVCQNEQKDDWAQKWQFQLRVCDATGTAVLASNRAAPNAAQQAASE